MLNMFKEKFKYYKRKTPPPDLSSVINFQLNNSELKNIAQTKANVNLTEQPHDHLGLIDPSKWVIYELNSHPGLMFINNPFTYIGQRYWIARCLADFTRKPYRLNIDPQNILGTNEDWWTSATQDNDQSYILLEKLRWSTLGYHHDWDTKEYSESLKGDFPDDLAKLSAFIVDVVLGETDFLAQAAIVNFYHMDSTLSGHTDHSEKNVHAPLISFSFGQSAIFLIGGESIHGDPAAMYLHSGDIVIMSGKSRLCYHGIPRIITGPSDPWNRRSNNNYSSLYHREFPQKKCIYMCDILDDVFWKPFDQYVKSSRININVRQVLFPGEEMLNGV